jgi:hypothetical protein
MDIRSVKRAALRQGLDSELHKHNSAMNEHLGTNSEHADYQKALVEARTVVALLQELVTVTRERKQRKPEQIIRHASKITAAIKPTAADAENPFA